MIFRFLFFTFLLLCISCESGPDKQSLDVADTICQCYQPLLDINDKVKSLMKNGKGKEAEVLIPEMSSLNAQAKECTLEGTKDARKNASLDVLKLEEAINESCPNVWASVKELLFE